MIASEHQRLIQQGDTDVRNNDNCAFVRTDVRRQAELAKREAKQLTPEERALEQQRKTGEAYAEAYRREQAEKAAKAKAEKDRADAKALACGELIIALDGTRLRKTTRGRYELYD
jgi:hypothetical protein